MEPVCDLVVLSWNNLEETQPCLETLFETTQAPCRLFIVDNGSEPNVREFLAGVKPRGAIQEVALLQNDTNEGFSRGMNRGMRASSAPFVCLLNNDLRFTTGWLEEMLAVADAHPEIGVLNPESDTFGNRPPQGMSLEAYAASLKPRRGRYIEMGMCIGFCFLIRREVIDRIGGLTEEVERFFFEDEDYCMRAKAANFQCVVVESAYVQHGEHKSVRRVPEREALFHRNRQWCERKWGRRLRVAYPQLRLPASGTEELRQWLERLIGWARNRALIYVYCPLSTHANPRDLFRSVGLIPHANISWHALPAHLTAVVAAAMILQRQKKRFDGVIVPNRRLAAWLCRLQMVHRARVIMDGDVEELQELWQTRFRSQL